MAKHALQNLRIKHLRVFHRGVGQFVNVTNAMYERDGSKMSARFAYHLTRPQVVERLTRGQSFE